VATKFDKDIEELEGRLIKNEKTLNNIKKTESSILARLAPSIPRAFQPSDIAQQIVGAWLILVPLTHFSEVLEIPLSFNALRLTLHVLIAIFLSIMIVYKANYQEVKREKWLGIPIRFLSLLVICAASTILMMQIYVEQMPDPLKLFLFLFGFAVLGSSTADIIK
jgi:uncharacterized membrane protein